LIIGIISLSRICYNLTVQWSVLRVTDTLMVRKTVYL